MALEMSDQICVDIPAQMVYHYAALTCQDPAMVRTLWRKHG